MTSAPDRVSSANVLDVESAPGVRGRRIECDVLSRSVAKASAGRSQVLVIRGERGIGKTVLLDHLKENAAGCRVVSASGVESETELTFAALHQFCRPFLDRLSDLPPPQRTALRMAFGLATGEQPDPIMVGLPVLNLLAAASADETVVCIVDDAQWLDHASAQTLAFVARRLSVEQVMIAFAVREPTHSREFAGFPELTLRGLGSGDAQDLLDSVVPGPVDARVRRRIVKEARGNPRALRDLPLSWTAAELADGFGVGQATPRLSRTEADFRLRVALLPADTQQLLLIAAAEPVGDVTVLWRVAAALGIEAASGTAAEAAGLIEFKGHLRFVHPLARSAVYRSASIPQRQRVHRALADATDSVTDPDRRAWHRALSIAGPSEDIGAELERSAPLALSHGGLAAAAAMLERAHNITPDAIPRARRGLAAASLMRDAGCGEASRELLEAVDASPSDVLRSAETEHLRGLIAFDQRPGDEATGLLLRAAQQLEPLDPPRAREMHLEALAAAMCADDPRASEMLRRAAEAAAAAPPSQQPARAGDVILEGLAERLTLGYAAAAPTLGRAVRLMRSTASEADDSGRFWLSANRVAGMVAREIWDDETAIVLGSRQVQVARSAGAFVQLQLALNSLASAELLAGRPSAAAGLIEEDREIARATGNPGMPYGDALLAAFRGREQFAIDLIRDSHEQAAAQGQVEMANNASYASAVLHNGLGRHDVAEKAAWRLFDGGVVGLGTLVVAELAEAASRTGEIAHLTVALEWLAERAQVTPTNWALGVEARTRALLSKGDGRDQLFRESINRLSRTRVRSELARTHLLYGEWLRREGRRVDAREHLRSSQAMFVAMKMEAFADRARRELLATGETVRKRGGEAADQLTAQERHVVMLARDGLTNPEIALQLFVSPRTVEWHLRKIFAKVGISSRKQLRNVAEAEFDAILG